MLNICYRRIRLFVSLSLMMILAVSAWGCSDKKTDVPLQMVKQDGQRLARINIREYGAVTFRLLSNEEPQAVNAFIEKAKAHAYDGTSFFDIIEDYLMIGGIEDGSGEKAVRAEMNGKLYPLRGALCANLLSDGTCSLDNFYVINLNKAALENIERLLEHKGYSLDDYIKFGYKVEVTQDELEIFRNYGGAPWLTGHTVVFGQAIEGMETLERIAEDYQNKEGIEVIIDSIETD